MLGERRIQLLALTSVGAVLVAMVGRVLPFVRSGWTPSPLDVYATIVLPDGESLALLSFAAAVVALAPRPLAPVVRLTAAGVLVAAAVLVPAALWVMWRTVAGEGADSFFVTASSAARAGVVVALAAITAVVLAAAAATASRRPATRAEEAAP